MPPLLTDEEVSRLTADLTEWTASTASLSRTFQAADFRTAIDMVVAVAEVAEEMNHHPDIDIRWRTLRFLLSTHAAGGVTRLDVELARRIERIITGADPSVGGRGGQAGQTG